MRSRCSPGLRADLRLAVRLMSRIHREFGRYLPLAVKLPEREEITALARAGGATVRLHRRLG